LDASFRGSEQRRNRKGRTRDGKVGLGSHRKCDLLENEDEPPIEEAIRETACLTGPRTVPKVP
jgi:hypothetical protein